MRAPIVVLAVGNPGRGDDAIGPLLAERLERESVDGVEVIVDFQLQVEHALDLEGRSLAVFVDAAVDCDGPFETRPLQARRDASHSSHALSPEAVLETFSRVTGREPPPALALAVRGTGFGLGEDLSSDAARNLEAAWPALLRLVRRSPVHRGQSPVGTVPMRA